MQQGQGQYPVDNNTYNMMQMLVNKLEALEVYRKYQKDADQQTRPMIDQLIQEDEQHASQLYDTLKRMMQSKG